MADEPQAAVEMDGADEDGAVAGLFSLYDTLAGRVFLVTLLAVIGVIVLRIPAGTQLDLGAAAADVLANRWYLVFVGLLTLLSVRRILFRLNDPET